jgi:hypothetical protein
LYSISPEGDDKIWKRFPKQTQALMTPMLTSRYKNQDIKKNPLPDVIFGSKEASTHVEWANLWASKLISFCKDDRAVCIFRACEPSLKRDTKVLLLFLKYILRKFCLRKFKKKKLWALIKKFSYFYFSSFCHSRIIFSQRYH